MKIITEEEISNVIDTLLNNKSSGLDSLTYEFYKDTKEEILLALSKLFNQVLDSESSLQSWSKSVITLILKKTNNLEDINN